MDKSFFDVPDALRRGIEHLLPREGAKPKGESGGREGWTFGRRSLHGVGPSKVFIE
jgi:hypothetical protein